MTSVSFGDLAQSFLLQRSNTAIKTTLQSLSTEVTTGIAADPGKALGGDFGKVGAIAHTLTTLQAYGLAATQAALSASAVQDSLSTLDGQATALSTSLLTAGSAGQPTGLQTVATAARGALEAAVSALNARVGSQSLFAGAATDRPAVASADALLASLGPVVAGQTTAAGVAQAVQDWFASPSGFAAAGYLGSATPASATPIAPGESAGASVTALDPAITATLAGLATAALIDTGPLVGNAPAQADLATLAGQALLSSSDARAGLAARVGVVQARISQAQTRNGSEATALQLAQSKLLAVDPYATATALQSTQTQLDTLYALTARISGLSLTNFLK
ncbi:MAG: flagellar biosynthesis protein FlgL [Rhodobacteraceae bacterium]|nr:flagellar biosynthesis protein FlgL [Paracoccaceae bacterium]